MNRIAFSTFGCRINQYDTETLRTLLEETGRFRTVSAREAADIHVVNTCSVTAQADASARKAIRRLGNRHPEARIVVTGCYAQRAPAEIAALPGVALVLGVPDRVRIVSAIFEMLAPADGNNEKTTRVSPVLPVGGFPEISIARMMNRSRAVVKVQDGCNGVCGFCIIPRTRGPSRSRDPGRVVDQASRLVDNGYPEIVLAGVNLGDYGRDGAPGRHHGPGDFHLAGLIRRILAIPGLMRLRLSSIGPNAVTREIIESMATEEKFARHFHIPLQSGSDEILARMNRDYRVTRFEALLREITDAIPDCGIGTDVICGFPGESEALFRETRARIADLPFSYLHPFPYSARPGAPAESLDGQVPGEERKSRTRILKGLSREKNRAFRLRHLDKEVSVLLEEREDRTGAPGGESTEGAGPSSGDFLSGGWTDNYLRVTVAGAGMNGGLRAVRITGIDEEGLVGCLADRFKGE